MANLALKIHQFDSDCAGPKGKYHSLATNQGSFEALDDSLKTEIKMTKLINMNNLTKHFCSAQMAQRDNIKTTECHT